MGGCCLCMAGLGGFSSAKDLLRAQLYAGFHASLMLGFRGSRVKKATSSVAQGVKDSGLQIWRRRTRPHPLHLMALCVFRQVIYLDSSVLVCKLCMTLKPASQDSLEGSTDIL